jgi:uncharacterized phosphosugar-binding protein
MPISVIIQKLKRPKGVPKEDKIKYRFIIIQTSERNVQPVSYAEYPTECGYASVALVPSKYNNESSGITSSGKASELCWGGSRFESLHGHPLS